MRRAGAGRERQRFVDLYNAHYEQVFRFAVRRAGAVDAADTTAETFAIAWRRLAEIPEGRELPWLYVTARNVIANEWRRRQKDPLLGAPPEPPPDDGDHAEEIGVRDQALRVLRRLRPDDLELLRLVAWERLETEEIAEMLSCSAAAVHSRLHRLRRKLVRELEGDRSGRHLT